MRQDSVFVVHPSDQPAMLVHARGWLQALGEALHRRGQVEHLTRLAFEVLPDGSAMAMDAVVGRRYTIRRV